MAAVAGAIAPGGAVELTEAAPGQFAVRGPLTFATARQARDTGLAALRNISAREIGIDCSGITSSDSAGLSVLLDWLAFAKSAGRSLRYAGLPEQLKALARISDVEELLEKGV
jgi:phospholipid transport system transporter-binding protein